MKKLTTILLLLSSFKVAQAQTYSMTNSPFTLSPKWFFGYYAGLDFTSGSAVFLNGNRSLVGESASTITDRSKNVVMYAPGYQVWMNGASSALLTNIGGTSSTQGAMIVPDPADPDNMYYVFTADDQTGGTTATIVSPDVAGSGSMAGNGGIWYFKVSKAGVVQAPTTGTKIANPTDVDESIAAGTDGTGGYWIISHGPSDTKFYVWHVTSSGVSSADIQSTGGTPSLNGATGSGGAIKFNHCQNKIAHVGPYISGSAYSRLQLFDWDRTTGKILNPSTPIHNSMAPAAASVSSYGVEIAPNDAYVFISDLTSPHVYQVNLSTSTWTPLSSTPSNASWNEFGGMQLAPDGKIYVTNGAFNPTSNVNIGVISTPTTTPSYSGTGFVMPSTSTPTGSRPTNFRGAANIAWLSPQTPTISETKTGCDVSFQYSFLNYFNEAVNTSSTEWSWDNGTTWVAGTNPQTHSFATNSYSVKVRFRDNSCNNLWTQTFSGSCVLPVDWLNVTASENGKGIEVSWSTSSEKNNSYFVIERSNDGQNFSEIGRVSGSLNSTSLNQYQFLDKYSGAGVNYYRIVQYDLNNSSSYSNIVAASHDNYFAFAIAPNPSKNDFELRIVRSEEEEAIISVTDLLGREIYYSTTRDFNSVQFGSDFAKGTYIVKVISGQYSATQKIIKE